MAVLENDQAAAKEQHTELLGKQGTMTSSVASVDRILGLLSHTMGETDQAAAHFEDALALCRKAGYRPELAWTCRDYADALLLRRGEGDAVRSAALLNESSTLASELGMGPLQERLGDLQASSGAQPVQEPIYPDGLTQREVEVLQLICSGKTDREIAEELFVSFRTVGNHVRNILNKTDTANRTEAATTSSPTTPPADFPSIFPQISSRSSFPN